MKNLKRKLTAAILSVLLATSSFTAAPISVNAATTEVIEADEGIGANETDGANDEVGAAENDSVGEAPISGTTGDCTWTLDEEGTLTISGNGRMGDYYYDKDESEFPYNPEWFYKSESIKSIVISDGVNYIGDYAFCDCTSLISITIPDSVTNIGTDAFFNTAWLNNQPDGMVYVGKVAYKYKGEMSADTTVDIKYGTIGIADNAFDGCTDLISVIIPDSVVTIGTYTFADCINLTNVNIPDSVTNIGAYAFYHCSEFTSINIPDSVISIGRSAFYRCYLLTSITIPDSVTFIGTSAFGNTAWLNNQPDGMVYAGKVAYKYKGEMPADTSFIIKEGTKGIAEYAFFKCTGLKNVTIPNSVTNIGGSAFDKAGLTSVTIPAGVSFIGEYAFDDCANLETVSIGSQNEMDDYYTTIGSHAFSDCENLSALYIGENVREIGKRAFEGCKKQKYVEIPNNTKVINDEAFYKCTNLEHVKIGFGLSFLGEKVFFGCDNLKNITVQESNSYFFSANGSLYSNEGMINGSGELEYDKNGVVTKVYNNSELILYNIKGTEEDVIIPKGVTCIKEDAFMYTEKIKSITIYKDLKTIESLAFRSHKNLIDVYYYGTRSQWKKVHGYYELEGFNGGKNIVMHFLDSEPIHGNLYESEEVDGIIKTKEIDGIKTELNESWFEDNSYYNHDLARLCSEMVVMGDHAESDKKVIDLEKSLSDLGFSDLEHCNDTGRDEENYFIASKKITKAGKVYNLVFCGCIGSNGKQWNSDFDPEGWGSGRLENDFDPLNHRGFDDAKDYIKRAIRIYCSIHYFDKDNTVLLLTGHSRGAATVNLLAASIIDDDYCWFVTPDNLFTYTFATPNTTCNENRANSKYNSIYNIVFPTDFITKVMPTAWGYGRYGTTYSLPTKSNDLKYIYRTDKKNASGVWVGPFTNSILSNNFGEHAYFGTNGAFIDILNPEDYNIFDYAYVAGYKCEMLKYRKLLNNGDGSFSDYNGESTVMDIIDTMTDHSSTIDEYYNDIYLTGFIYMTPFLFFQKYVCPHVNGSDKKPEWYEYAIFMGTYFLDIAFFFKDHAQDSHTFNYAHEPQTYCAFMLAMNSDEVTIYRKGYNGSVNCPVDIEITEKESGEVVGRIVDNTVDEEIAAKPNSVVMTVDGDEKEFWLPGNGEYDVRLIGNDNGVMDYTVREIDPDTGETNRVNYYDVPVEKDKAYTDFFTSEKAFVITAENGSELTPDETFTSENEVTYSVTVTAEGSGTASDSLTVTSGDYVTLTASPVESEFLGWYQNDTLVSTDLEYRFRPTEDISLTAKFTGEDLKPVEFGDVDVDGEVTISDATQIQMYLAELVELEDIQVLLSDYNLDGSVDISDATQIQLKLAELI